MKKASIGIVWGAVGWLLSGCGAAGDPDLVEDDQLGSVRQALVRPHFELVTDTEPHGTAVAFCGGNTMHALGAGGEVPASLGMRLVVPGDDGRDEGNWVWATAQAGTTTARTVCSDAPRTIFEGPSPIGDRTVGCPSGMIAVGGGATCWDDGKLYRSRPSPATDGSKPTGWRASCTSGDITTYAVCVEEDDKFDFTDCHTEVAKSKGSATVECPANHTAVTAGGYCGGGVGLFNMKLSPDLSTVKIGCQGLSSNKTANAYAVCCG